MNIKESEAREHSCPRNNFAPCLGAKCMAWVWSDRPYETTRTDNILRTEGPESERPEGVPPYPPGDGWERDGDLQSIGYHQSSKKKALHGSGLQQMWRRKLPQANGGCGLVNESHFPY